MFPTGGSGSNSLSSMQQQVIQASPLYRGIVEEGGGPAMPLQPGDGQSDQTPARVEPVVRGDVDGATRGASRVAMSTARRSASWRQGLPGGLADYLSGLWCPDVRRGPRAHAGGRSPAPQSDFYGVLSSLGGDDVATLLAIATDGAAPIQARTRAFAAVGRAAPPEEARAPIAATARDTNAPRQVRVAALGAARRAWPDAGLELARDLSADGDRFVAQAALRARAR
jgi:hypothetical protein